MGLGYRRWCRVERVYSRGRAWAILDEEPIVVSSVSL